MQKKSKIRKNKYNNIRVVTKDGIKHASKKEAKRWMDLCFLEKQGKIKNLRRQVRFPLLINYIKIGAYIADFVYEQREQEIIEDTKGFQTSIFKIKKKIFEAQYNKKITLS